MPNISTNLTQHLIRFLNGHFPVLETLILRASDSVLPRLLRKGAPLLRNSVVLCCGIKLSPVFKKLRILEIHDVPTESKIEVSKLLKRLRTTPTPEVLGITRSLKSGGNVYAVELPSLLVLRYTVNLTGSELLSLLLTPQIRKYDISIMWESAHDKAYEDIISQAFCSNLLGWEKRLCGNILGLDLGLDRLIVQTLPSNHSPNPYLHLFVELVLYPATTPISEISSVAAPLGETLRGCGHSRWRLATEFPTWADLLVDDVLFPGKTSADTKVDDTRARRFTSCLPTCKTIPTPESCYPCSTCSWLVLTKNLLGNSSIGGIVLRNQSLPFVSAKRNWLVPK